MDSSELRKAKFTGLRHNSITSDAEIWILGNLEERISKQQVLLDPDALNKAYERLFGLVDVMPDRPDLRNPKEH
jgi:hypothetical protein